jgi:hypothetical protein
LPSDDAVAVAPVQAIRAGADPDPPSPEADPPRPRFTGASSDDLEVAAALIDGGADIEAPGGSIAGTPLGNAGGDGCWHVARLLVERGARIESLWQAALDDNGHRCWLPHRRRGSHNLVA